MNKLDAKKSLAEEALEKSDATALKRILDESFHECEMLIQSLGVVMDHGKNNPRPSEFTIAAMRDVALAAIALARDVAAEKGA